MQAQIIFVAAFALLWTGLICVSKVSERISFVTSAIVGFITELCIGAVLAGVYSLLHIPVQLFSMGAGYALCAVLIWGFIVWQRKIQPMSIYAVDIYAFGVMTIFFLLLFYQTFTLDIQLVYTNIDPANHFMEARKVMQTGVVSRMYFAALHNGLIMSLFEPFLAEISLYKAFILADTLFNFVNILMFYVLLTTVFKSKILKILAPFICILYYLGWPLYSFVGGGFVYFGIGATLFAYVIYLLIEFVSREKKSEKWMMGILSVLGTFSLTVCYMLFVPVLCVVVFAYVCYAIKTEKIYIPRKTLILVTVSAVVFGIILFCICFFGFFGGNVDKIFGSLKLEGGIHKQIYEDFIFLLPPAVYMICKNIKEKRMNFLCLTLAGIGLVIAVSFAACAAGMLSGYYFYKFYYLLWMFCWLVCAEAIEYFWNKDRMAVCAYGIPFVTAIAFLFSNTAGKLADGNLVNANTKGIFPIYETSYRCVAEQNEEHLAQKDALADVSGYIIENYTEHRQDIPMINSYEKSYLNQWYKAFTGSRSYTVYEKGFDEILNELEEGGYRYMVIYKATDYYAENEATVNRYEVIYDNGYYGLYQLAE